VKLIWTSEFRVILSVLGTRLLFWEFGLRCVGIVGLLVCPERKQYKRGVGCVR